MSREILRSVLDQCDELASKTEAFLHMAAALDTARTRIRDRISGECGMNVGWFDADFPRLPKELRDRAAELAEAKPAVETVDAAPEPEPTVATLDAEDDPRDIPAFLDKRGEA